MADKARKMVNEMCWLRSPATAAAAMMMMMVHGVWSNDGYGGKARGSSDGDLLPCWNLWQNGCSPSEFWKACSSGVSVLPCVFRPYGRFTYKQSERQQRQLPRCTYRRRSCDRSSSVRCVCNVWYLMGKWEKVFKV